MAVSSKDRVARLFGLEGEAWLRHANPWSVYTRIPIPPVLALAVWSRDWIGWWSLVPIGAVLVWTAINPRVFPPPRSLDHWASKAVLGETVWTRRGTVPLPRAHRVAPLVLSGISAVGVPVLVWGLVVLDLWMVVAGLTLQMAGKNWLLDRMVWLYDDVSRDGVRPEDLVRNPAGVPPAPRTRP
jgi:hypothetical protein